MTRLTRPRLERMIGGVCGGLGLYFGIDPVIVRLVFVVLAFTNGIALVLYPILWLVMPDEPVALPPDARFDPQTGQPLPLRPAPPALPLHTPVPNPAQRHRNLALVLLGIGAVVLLSNLGQLLHVNLGDIGLPLLLVGFGLYLLRGTRTKG